MKARHRLCDSLIIVVIILAVTLTSLFWKENNDTPPPYTDVIKTENSDSQPYVIKTKSAVTINTPSRKEYIREELVNSSLKGSRIFHIAIESENNYIKLDGQLIFYFDYFLSLSGEKSTEEIEKIIFIDLHAHYSKHIAQQLYGIFKRYQAYLHTISEAIENTNTADVNLSKIDIINIEENAQKQHFNEEEIQQLFSDYKDILSKKSNARFTQRKMADYQQAISNNIQDQQAIATELFGSEAAQRLQQQSNNRNLWQQRLHHYQCERRTISNSEGLTDNDKNQQILELQQRMFSQSEQRRINALESEHLLTACAS